MINGPKPRDVADRFWEKVRKTDDCWEWTAAVHCGGYGLFNFRRRSQRAHRVSWILANGEIPKGMLVCHTCDNKLCVRPDHLFLGTYQDNNTDMCTKKRHSFGSKNGRSKLTENDVAEIRRLRDDGWLCREIAAEYGVTKGAIIMISCGRNWRQS